MLSPVPVLLAYIPIANEVTPMVSDIGISTKDFGFIKTLLVANIVLVISASAGNWVRSSLSMHLATRIKISLLTDYLFKLFKLPVSYFENKLIGDIIQRARDHERIQTFMMSSLFNSILAILTIAFFGTIMFIYESTLFWIFMIGSVIYAIWILSFWLWRKKLDIKYFELKAKDHSQWIENLSCFQEIKLNNYSQKKRWKWESVQNKLYRINIQLLKLDQGQQLGSDFINAIKNIALTFYSAKAVIDGNMTIGMLIAVLFIIGQLNGPLNTLIGFITSSQMAFLSFMRLSEVNNSQDEEDSDNQNNLFFPEEKTLRLNNVSYRYGVSDPFVIQNINLSIPQGKVTALVGPRGSGKSTLIKLMLRLYEPMQGGDMFIGNSNAKSISLKLWREKSGAVLQGSQVFNDTILNNIVLGADEMDYDRFYEVMESVNLNKEIELLHLGYKTELGEGGRGLSAGQKQRIIVARALYKNPDYLFLDEPTSFLDSHNESHIIKEIREKFSGKTVVLAAHRLSTIIEADQIAVIVGGTIVELGNHRELIKRKGFYTKLFEKQIGMKMVVS